MFHPACRLCLLGLLALFVWTSSGCAERKTVRYETTVGYVEPEERAPQRVPGDDPFRPAVPRMD
jgi:hypothetical protein